MIIDVLRPGLQTTLQDRGRFGCAMLGVGTAGAMDDVASRLANALAGNAPDAPLLEIALTGPTLRFDAAATIALTGAECTLRSGEESLPMWQPVAIPAGSTVEIGRARRGARAYLAIAGTFAVAPTLGSVATDVAARLGGAALREGDRIEIVASDGTGTPMHRTRRRWSLDPSPWFDADASQPIRVIRGAHFDALDAASRASLFDATFRIAADSNRVGYRLDGSPLALAAPLELVSEPLAIGTLQLPPGGQPIVLMAEHPTVGGYPRIGQVATVDLPHLAQRRPGDPVRFAEIDLGAAQTRYLERERELARMIDAIRERLIS